MKHRKYSVLEDLENRQFLSATALGEIRFGGKRTLQLDNQHNVYSFTLNKPALLSAQTNFGLSVKIRNDGKEVTSGSRLSTVLPVGRYTLSAITGSQSGEAVTMSLSATNVPTRLQADAWGSGAVHLNWDDNSTNEASYRVDRWTHIGWRRSVRVGTDATAAVIDNLKPGSAVTYRVSSVTADGISTRSANIVSATTSTESTVGWYQVSLSGGTQGDAGWTLSKDTLKVLPDLRDGSNTKKSIWIYSSSWQSAVYTVVSSWDDGTAQNDPVSIKTSNTDSSGNPIYQTHSFPSGGDFKVATGHDLKNDPNVTDFDLPDNGTKYIVVEDSYGGIDHDYDDFSWKVTTKYLNETLGGGPLNSTSSNNEEFDVNGVELLKDGSPISGHLKFESSDPAYIDYPATVNTSASGPVSVNVDYDPSATSVSVKITDVDHPGISWPASASLGYGTASPETSEKIAAERERLKSIGKIFINCLIVTTELGVVQLEHVVMTTVSGGVFDPTSYGDYDVFTKTGGMNQANADFDKIASDNLVQGLVQNLGGGIRTVVLPDGANVTVYPVSTTTGAPTIAIVNQKYGKHRTKIRYP